MRYWPLAAPAAFSAPCRWTPEEGGEPAAPPEALTPAASPGTSSTGSEPAAHRLSGRPSLQPWYFAASRSARERLALLALDHAGPSRRACDRRSAHGHVGRPAGCGPSAPARGRRRAGRSARHRWRTRSRSSAAGPMRRPGRLEVADRVAGMRGEERGDRHRAAAGGRHGVDAAAELVPEAARRPRRPPPRRGGRRPASGAPRGARPGRARAGSRRPGPGRRRRTRHGRRRCRPRTRSGRAQRDGLVQPRRVVVEEGDGAGQSLVERGRQLAVAREAVDDRIGGHRPRRVAGACGGTMQRPMSDDHARAHEPAPRPDDRPPPAPRQPARPRLGGRCRRRRGARRLAGQALHQAARPSSGRSTWRSG